MKTWIYASDRNTTRRNGIKNNLTNERHGDRTLELGHSAKVAHHSAHGKYQDRGAITGVERLSMRFCRNARGKLMHGRATKRPVLGFSQVPAGGRPQLLLAKSSSLYLFHLFPFFHFFSLW